jgi:2,3-bisphosphoglycerate-dependent phosphoglycerate mutase
MQLYLIRHGQSTNNARWETQDGVLAPRSSDPPLTEIGVRQAQVLAELLAVSKPGEEDFWRDPQNRLGFKLTHIYSSLMHRAVHTASIIADRLNLPLVGLPEAHEVGGIYLESVVNDIVEISFEHGVNEAFLSAHYPRLKLVKPIDSKGWWRGGKEDHSLPLKRAQGVLNWIKERHLGSEDRVAIVTHGGFYNYLLRAMLQISLDQPDNRKLEYSLIYNNCAISRFDFVANRIVMVYHNRVDFLTDDLVT